MWKIIIYSLVFSIAISIEAPLVLYLLLAPYLAIPAALIGGAFCYTIVYFGAETLKVYKCYSLLNLLALGSVFSLLCAFIIPVGFSGGSSPNPSQVLLEEYTHSLVRHALFWNVLGFLWWGMSPRAVEEKVA